MLDHDLLQGFVSRRLVLTGAAATSLAVVAGCSSSTAASTSASASTTASANGTAAAGSVAALAQAFYNTLGTDLQAAVLFDYSLANAERWSNLPQSLSSGGGGGVQSGAPGGGGSGGPSGGSSAQPSNSATSGGGGTSGQSRIGINLGQLSDDQLTAFNTLLKAATGTASGLGYEEIQAHLAADDYLGENGGGDDYSRDNFYVALLGSPQDSGTWQFQFGGHHLAVANTYIDGALAGATPAFRGIEPRGDFTWENTTYNALEVKEAAFIAMLAALSTAQLATAKLSDTYSDLLLGPGNDWSFPTERVGVKVSTLSSAQQKLVLAAIASYVNDITDGDAKTILAGYQSDLGDTYLAYSGTTALTEQNDYVRIDGPGVWIEFSMQRGVVLSGNHPHSVWRDRNTDYGGTKS